MKGRQCQRFAKKNSDDLPLLSLIALRILIHVRFTIRNHHSHFLEREKNMSPKYNVTIASITAVIAIALFAMPFANLSVHADRSQVGLHKGNTLTSMHHVSMSSEVVKHYFGTDAVKKALAVPENANVRMSYGKYQDGSTGYVISNVDKKGNEQIMVATIPGGNGGCPNCQ